MYLGLYNVKKIIFPIIFSHSLTGMGDLYKLLYEFNCNKQLIYTYVIGVFITYFNTFIVVFRCNEIRYKLYREQ